MPDFEYDFRYLQAGVELLEKYLLAPEVYWPIGASAPVGASPYPQMTLGGLMLARKRARAGVVKPAQSMRLTEVENNMDNTINQWRSAFSKKASQELRGRLTQWGNFLEDYRSNPESNHDRYSYEIFRRVIIELLTHAADDLPDAYMDMQAGLDSLLKTILKPGSFIWDINLEIEFPSEKFWYLYGSLPDNLTGERGNR